MTKQPIETTKFVILKGLVYDNNFFTEYTPDAGYAKLATGEVAYKILGYASTVEEAQTFLFGRSYPY
jgi:hypothetical protein